MPAMGTNFEPVTGPLSPATYDYFLARARGGVGLILMSAVGWARMEMEPPPGQDSGHQKLVELLHRRFSLPSLVTC